MMITARAAIRYIACAVLLTLLLGLAGTGCQWAGRGNAEEADVTAELETSRKQFRSELQEVEQMLQPAEFRLTGSEAEIPMSCLDDGRSYLFDVREAAGPIDDPKGKANLIAEHWRGKGYQVEITPLEETFQVSGRTPDGGRLTFVAGERAMALHGESPCVTA
jgi:hypothetical protein